MMMGMEIDGCDIMIPGMVVIVMDGKSGFGIVRIFTNHTQIIGYIDTIIDTIITTTRTTTK
jgi:hypothetical protein